MTLRPDTEVPARQTSWRGFLDTLATIGIIAVSASVLWGQIASRRAVPHQQVARQVTQGQTPTPVPREALSITGAATKGRSTARIGVIEFSDFQCPFCGVFARDTFPKIDKDLIEPGKVLFAFRQLPLVQIHQFAMQAAIAATCAASQHYFWQMQDALFHHQESLQPAQLHSAASSLGLDTSRFDACVSAPPDQVREDMALAARLGVHGTPTFFVGRFDSDGALTVSQVASGALSEMQFTKLITTAEKGGQ